MDTKVELDELFIGNQTTPSEPLQFIFEYDGEDRRELINKLAASRGVDWANYNRKSDNPIGIIVIKHEYSNAWIRQRKGFMGWNVTIG